MISVICPTYNEEKFIKQCIESLLLQDYPKEDLEIIFIDGRSTDKTRDIISSYSESHPFIHLIDNPMKIVPYALNEGIKASKGDIIIRIDGHEEYPTNYISTLSQKLIELNADNVGCLFKTLPCGPSAKEIAIAEALSSSFGMGNSYYRIGCDSIKEVDTVPFGCYRRSVFDRFGLFDTDLIRNQDDEFNGRITKGGGKIYLIPNIIIKYYARDKIRKVRKMFYQYGLFKPLVNKKLGSPTTVRQFIPLFFVIGLLAGAALSFLHQALAIAYAFTMLAYFALALAFTAKSYKMHKNIKLFIFQPLIYFTIHSSYGFGYLVGIFKIIFGSKFNGNSNR